MAAGEGVRSEVGHIAAIEGLRGVAVLLVIAFHYAVVREARFADPWIALLEHSRFLKVVVSNGALGVDLFFLITGFLLVLPWLRHAAQGRAAPSALEFYRRRAKRILPAYYVHLLLLFFVFVPLLLGIAFWRWNPTYMLQNLWAHTFLVHYFTPTTSASMTINGALWTLALEAQFYVLLPLLAPVFARAPWRTAAAMFTIALAWRWAANHSLDAWVRHLMAIEPRWNLTEPTVRHLLLTQFPGYLGHFAAGMLAGRAWLHWRGDPPTVRGSWAWLALAMAILAALWAMYAYAGPILGERTWILTVAAIGTAMLALVSRGLPQARVLLGNAPLAFAGRISYSAYLYHLPLLLLWSAYGPAAAGSWLALPLYVAQVAGIAWLSYRWIELPGLGWRLFSRARSHPQRGDDGQRLQESHAPQHLGVAARVHQQAEGERREREARVDA